VNAVLGAGPPLAAALSTRVPTRRWGKLLGGSGLHRTTRGVLRALADGWMGPDGGSAWPSLESIATAADCSVATVCVRLAEAEQAGWLRRERSKGGTDRHGRGITTRYFAVVPADHAEAAIWAGATEGQLRRGRRPIRPRGCAESAGNSPASRTRQPQAPKVPEDYTPPAPAAVDNPTSATPDDTGETAPPTGHYPTAAARPGWLPDDRFRTARRAARRLVDALRPDLAELARAQPAGLTALARALAEPLAAGWTVGELVDLVVHRYPRALPALVDHPAHLLATRVAPALAGRSPAVQQRARRAQQAAAERAAAAEQAAQQTRDAGLDRAAAGWWAALAPVERHRHHAAFAGLWGGGVVPLGFSPDDDVPAGSIALRQLYLHARDGNAGLAGGEAGAAPPPPPAASPAAGTPPCGLASHSAAHGRHRPAQRPGRQLERPLPLVGALRLPPLAQRAGERPATPHDADEVTLATLPPALVATYRRVRAALDEARAAGRQLDQLDLSTSDVDLFRRVADRLVRARRDVRAASAVP